MNQVQADRQLTRVFQLQQLAREAIAAKGYQPAQILNCPDGDGYSIAFGYRERVGGEVRQRYIEIYVTAEEYRAMDAAAQDKVLQALNARLDELRP